MESEIYSANSGSKEGIWTIHLLSPIYPHITSCLLIIDNEKAQLFIEDRKITCGKIHYDMDLFAIRNWVQENKLITKFASSSEQYADPLTKPYKDLNTLLIALQQFGLIPY